MPRLIAFLRAINVGGHTVKMDVLRQSFESLGLTKVETFIASGNVIFETTARNTAALENKIAAHLHQALGYEVATFIRTETELAQLTAYQPFPKVIYKSAVAFNIAFLNKAPDAQSIARLMAKRTEIDDFAVNQREVYWLCRTGQSDSTFSNAVLEKTLGQPATLRGVNTLQKLVAKYSALGTAK
jgi:uncharacterized protein (DUF1697 family)